MASRVRAPTVALTASLTSGGAIAVAAGGLWRSLALGAATLGLGASLSSVVVSRKALKGVLFVEVPVLLLLASSLVWRVRTTDDIAADPLDAAGQIRVGCVGLAGLLALTALVWPARSETRVGRTPLPFRLYGAYVLVVFAGAPLSVQPLLTAYGGWSWPPPCWCCWPPARASASRPSPGSGRPSTGSWSRWSARSGPGWCCSPAWPCSRS